MSLYIKRAVLLSYHYLPRVFTYLPKLVYLVTINYRGFLLTYHARPQPPPHQILPLARRNGKIWWGGGGAQGSAW